MKHVCDTSSKMLEVRGRFLVTFQEVPDSLWHALSLQELDLTTMELLLLWIPG